MQAFAYFNLYELFIAGQIVTGLALGLSTSLITPYINEISHESYAPFLHVLVAVTIEIGTTTANFVGIDDILGEKRRWPIVFVFPVIFNIVCIIFFIVWGPETPIRLLKCSKRVEALQSFRFYHQLDDMAAAQLLAESEKQMATAVSTRPMTMKQALVDRANRKALFLACLTGATTNFSGILCITIFGTNIIAQYSEDSAPYINAGVFATSLFGLLIALFCVKDFSHRLLLLIGLPILLVIDIGFAVVQVMELKGNYAMIIFVSLMIAFCAVFSNTLEKIMVFNGVRITRYEYLDATVSIAVAVTFLTTFLAPLAFYPLQQSYPKFSFVPFIIFLIIAWISYFIWYPNDSRVQPSDLQASQSNFKSSGNEKPLTQTGGTKEKV
ncbi:MFS domain-containing protein [Aphelenchoides besseyi]|nr:MFS domain-containing protein [Aphelenchoides besseyi]